MSTSETIDDLKSKIEFILEIPKECFSLYQNKAEVSKYDQISTLGDLPFLMLRLVQRVIKINLCNRKVLWKVFFPDDTLMSIKDEITAEEIHGINDRIDEMEDFLPYLMFLF